MPQHRRKHKTSRAPAKLLTAVVANAAGEIFDLEGYAAVGMAGPVLTPLNTRLARPIPHGSEFMFLPDRFPVVFDIDAGELVALMENPYAPGEPIFAVAAFNSPGYLITQLCCFEETEGAGLLPLFSYGAVGWHGEGFRTAVIQVDRERRQDLRLMPRSRVQAGVRQLQRQMPQNRLRRHLEKCALQYGCPAAKNFFIGRCEAPLPASPACNARCLGCLSLQKDSPISCSQERIDFTPTPEEIAEVALAHIERVPDGVVSFGQGCEGDPLLAADTIEPAIRLIRRQTDCGTVNLNTNASLPETVARLFDAGLDSMRVSINSLRPDCYRAYFKPRGYTFADVMLSITNALARDGHVTLNYLNLPGFTDTPEEFAALAGFLEERPIDLIQWRNLNYDPLRYYEAMRAAAKQGTPMGVANLLKQVKKRFPNLKHGYFNPALTK